MSSNLGARVLLVVAYLCAVVGYGGWMATRTVLDPSATRSAATTVLAAPSVQRVLTDDITREVRKELSEAGVDADVRAAVEGALRDPRVTASFADAIESLHRAIVNGGATRNITIDARAVTGAVHDALARIDTKLAAEFERQTKTAPIEVQLGRSDMPHFANAHNTATLAMIFGAVGALLLGSLSLLLVHDRRAIRRVGRRVAYLAITPLLLFALLPRMLDGRGDVQDIAAAVMRSYGGRVVPSAIGFAVLGVVVWMVALVWPRRPGAELTSPPVAPGETLPSPMHPAAPEPAVPGKLYL